MILEIDGKTAIICACTSGSMVAAIPHFFSHGFINTEANMNDKPMDEWLIRHSLEH